MFGDITEKKDGIYYIYKYIYNQKGLKVTVF